MYVCIVTHILYRRIYVICYTYILYNYVLNKNPQFISAYVNSMQALFNGPRYI